MVQPRFRPGGSSDAAVSGMQERLYQRHLSHLYLAGKERAVVVGLARKGTLVHTYPKGSDLFTTVPRQQDSDREVQERRIIGPTPWPVVVIRFE